MFNHSIARSRCWLGLISILLLVSFGCEKRVDPFFSNPARTNTDIFSDSESDLVSESWYVHKIRNAKVGHRRFAEYTFRFEGQPCRRLVSTDWFEFRRFGSVNEQKLTQISIESTNGTVMALGYELTADQSSVRFEGKLDNGQLKWIQIEGGDKVVSIPFPDTRASIFALNHQLSASPATAIDKTIWVFRPLAESCTQIQIRGSGQKSSIDILGDNRELFEFEELGSSKDRWLQTTKHWVNHKGQIVKTSIPFLSREMILADREDAESLNDLVTIDVGLDTGIRLNELFERPREATSAVYEIKADGLPIDKIVPSAPGQDVQVHGDSVILTVRKVGPHSSHATIAAEDQPTSFDLQPNSLIDADHPLIKATANYLSAKTDNDWGSVQAFRSHLFRVLDKNSLGHVFEPAGRVMENKSGDCSEHAVCLAALCRDQGIPARVAIGLIYSNQQKAFLYHMWNEVWMENVWIPVDATIPGDVAADHIKLASSNLAGETAFNVVAPITNLLGKLEIKLLSVDYQTSKPSGDGGF